jgi:hypothetical protein
MKCLVIEPIKAKGKRHAPGASLVLDAKLAEELIASGTVVEDTPEARATLGMLEAEADLPPSLPPAPPSAPTPPAPPPSTPPAPAPSQGGNKQ